MSWVEWCYAATLGNQLPGVVGGAGMVVQATVAVGTLKNFSCTHLVRATVVAHVTARSLRCLVLRLLLISVQRAWILSLAIA